MRKLFLMCFTALLCVTVFSKTVYIPADFSTDTYYKQWSTTREYQSTNFVIFWGPYVGTNPATFSNTDLAFNPQSVADTLEKSYAKYISGLGFCSDAATTNLGKYKIIIVMLNTWTAPGAGGPEGFAYGGSYDNTIGAMWVCPAATRDGGALSHEFAHSLQGQNSFQTNTLGGGFMNYGPSGFFWETHANFMRAQIYNYDAVADLPRWFGTQNYVWSSSRHHYDAFDLLVYMQQAYGIAAVNNLWGQSVANEHPLTTFKRLNGLSQTQLCDFVWEYAKREVTHDLTPNGIGRVLRIETNRIAASEPHFLRHRYTVLDQISATTARYSVPYYMAPQDYGYNIIPLYPTCSSNTVHIKFKGQTGANSYGGWRWGFVASNDDGSTVTYSAMYNTSDGEASYTLPSGYTKMYLVVVGAPTTHHDYDFDPGFMKTYRYPYEVRIENAMPEGYQSTYRASVKTLYPGAAHSNGGGWVASTATVASTVYVAPNAIVLGASNLSGSVQVNDRAWVQDITASGSVVFSKNAMAWNGTYTGTAQITEGAMVDYCTVSGNTIVKGNALEWGVTLGGTGVVVGGDAEIGSCSTAGYYLQFANSGTNGRTECDGKGVSDASNVDINTSITQFTDAQMAWTAIGCGTDAQAPTTPGTPAASSITSSGCALSWTASTDNIAVAGYQVLQNGSAVQTVTTNAATISGLTASTTYAFTIKAYDAAGNYSAASTAVSVTTSAASTAPVAGTIYQITSVLSGKSFCMRGGTGQTGNSVQLTQYPYQSGTHQQFKVEANGSYFRLTPQHATDKALMVASSSTSNNANVVQYAYTSSTTSQQWSFVSLGSGYYQIKNRNSGKCMQVAGASTADDANIQQYTCNTATTSQKFTFTAVAGSQNFEVATNIDVNNPSSGISVYPNPVTNEFTVRVNNFSANDKVVLYIYDVNGKEVLRNNINDNRVIGLNVSSFSSSGNLYFIKAVGSSKIEYQKIIVVR